jgi:hypothetical protein
MTLALTQKCDARLVCLSQLAFRSSQRVNADRRAETRRAGAGSRRCSGVPAGLLDELHPGGQAEFGVDMGEVGLHGAR